MASVSEYPMGLRRTTWINAEADPMLFAQVKLTPAYFLAKTRSAAYFEYLLPHR
jgi:hypothetical protein